MYPFVIIWSTENLRELYDDFSYSYVDDLIEIDDVANKYFENFLIEFEEKIQAEIEHTGTITLSRFYEMINSNSYMDFLFFEINYFDYEDKMWKEYQIKEDIFAKKLNEYLCKIIL